MDGQKGSAAVSDVKPLLAPRSSEFGVGMGISNMMYRFVSFTSYFMGWIEVRGRWGETKFVTERPW
jgi:hypothetical protein